MGESEIFTNAVAYRAPAARLFLDIPVPLSARSGTHPCTQSRPSSLQGGHHNVLIFIIGFGAITLVLTNPELAEAGTIKGGAGAANMAAVLVAKIVGGNVFFGFISAVAFATILAPAGARGNRPRRTEDLRPLTHASPMLRAKTPAARPALFAEVGTQFRQELSRALPSRQRPVLRRAAHRLTASVLTHHLFPLFWNYGNVLCAPDPVGTWP